MKTKALAKKITVEDLRSFKANVTSSPKKSFNFLKKVGIIDKKGEITEAYRVKENVLSYRSSK